MARTLLVDGHSVLHAWPDLRALHQRQPRQARETLVARLRKFHDAGTWEVTIVFDGQKGTAIPSLEGDLQVLYSRTGQSADSVIEGLVGRHRNAKEITVITADGGEKTTVEALGAFCLSPDWLRLEMESVLGEFEEDFRRRFGKNG